MKNRLISGLTSTGKLTLGNYLGSLKNLKDLQKNKDNEVFLFVADSHALTSNIDPKELKSNVEENLKLYLSCGIDYKKVKLFIQSHIIQNIELFYYLLTISYKGELERMTQYKDRTVKLGNKTENVPLGVFVYPTLMAADIMLYNAEQVVVGDDQTQHIELTRVLIDRFNKKYKTNFKKPIKVSPKLGTRIMALKNPDKKMSKSDDDKTNTIFLLDKKEDVLKKIKSALTDSENKVYFDQKNKPGVSNLLTIYSSLKEQTIEQSEKHFKNKNYGEFKQEVFETVWNTLDEIQKKFNKLKPADIKNALNFNIKEIEKIAKTNIDIIKKSLGLI